MKSPHSIIVAPSLLAADFASLGSAVDKIKASGADWVHWDVMDGRFVPNLSFGPPVVQSLRPKTELFFDVHLMVEKPTAIAMDSVKAGANAVTFHWEAEDHHHRLLDYLRSSGVQAGLAIVPSTPAEVLTEILPFVDIVLVMTVNPGFGGQQYLAFCENKIQKLAVWRAERGLSYRISVDGGIQVDTAIQATNAGADTLVTGSAFFSAKDPAAFVQILKSRSPK